MKRLSEAEQELMMIIWEYEEPASKFQIEEKLDPQKEMTLITKDGSGTLFPPERRKPCRKRLQTPPRPHR